MAAGTLAVVYALLAVAFRSYVQPLIVMAAIPFGTVGAVLGHMLFGYDLSLISLMGVVAIVFATAIILGDRALPVPGTRGCQRRRQTRGVVGPP